MRFARREKCRCLVVKPGWVTENDERPAAQIRKEHLSHEASVQSIGVLYLIFSKKGAMVFSDEYKEIIRQTPEMKYRTSIVVWIFLGLLVLLIVVGIISAFSLRQG